MSLNSKGWKYVGIVALLSIIPYYFIIQAGDSDSSWTLALMWVPALAAIIMRLLNKASLFNGIQWNPLKDFKWLLVAAFTPLIIEILSLILTLLLDGAELKPDFISLDDGKVSIKGVALIFGAASQPWYLFIFNYLISFFVCTRFYGFLFTLGEEYGWRGYLQKQWAPVNEFKGFVAIGVVWGLWHFPAILLGHNYPHYPILGAFILMPLLCTLFSIVFGLAFSRKHVIWVAILFHSALNLSSDVSNTAFIESTVSRPVNDMIWTLLWLITALIFWTNFKYKIKNKNEVI